MLRRVDGVNDHPSLILLSRYFPMASYPSSTNIVLAISDAHFNFVVKLKKKSMERKLPILHNLEHIY